MAQVGTKGMRREEREKSHRKNSKFVHSFISWLYKILHEDYHKQTSAEETYKGAYKLFVTAPT